MRGTLALVTTSLVGLAVLVAASAPVACSTSYPPCYRGEYQGCVCANGAHGYQQCNVTEDGYQACVCDGTTPGVDGGRDSGAASLGDAADASEGATGGQYLTSCDANGACAGPGAICFEFPTKGKVCTKPCTQPADCPAPSPGCSSNQSVCRPP
jgi:hypothetical protein